jgi:hypothetical protein
MLNSWLPKQARYRTALRSDTSRLVDLYDFFGTKGKLYKLKQSNGLESNGNGWRTMVTQPRKIPEIDSRYVLA